MLPSPQDAGKAATFKTGAIPKHSGFLANLGAALEAKRTQVGAPSEEKTIWRLTREDNEVEKRKQVKPAESTGRENAATRSSNAATLHE